MQIKGLRVILILFKVVIVSDGFLLHGSAGPLTARLGGAVLLPCFVDRPLPLEELQVDWRRTDSDTIVHLFQGGQSRPESQGDAYRDRAHFFSQEIPKGNFSLLLEGVRTADAGGYECVVYTEQENHETRVEIQEVERLVVTGADEPVYAHAGEDVTLSCSVDTHVNVTELQVVWKTTDDDIMVLLYADGENKPDSQHERYSGRAEFFTEEIPKGNFSMKLRKVRMEDKGEFRCEVHTDTDSNSTTARIAALGYSSLHWLILGLCITVIPVVLLTGAFSVRYYIKKSKGRQALLSHWSLVAVPPIMVSSAFILWGVTEGSTEEAVTCTVITLLNILMLFFMDPERLYPDVSRYNIYLARTLGSTIIIIAVCTVRIIEFSTKYSATTAGKVTLGVFIGGFVLMMVFMASIQFLFMWYFNSSLSWSTFKKILLTISVFLIIMVLATIGVGVFLANYFSGRADIGSFLTVFIVPVIMLLITFAVTGIAAWKSSSSSYFYYYYYNTFWEGITMMFNMQILTLYIQLIAWMQGTFLLGYFIPIIVASLGIYACFIAKLFLESFRHFYLFQKILLGILFPLHLILSLLYLSLVLDNDKDQATPTVVRPSGGGGCGAACSPGCDSVHPGLPPPLSSWRTFSLWETSRRSYTAASALKGTFRTSVCSASLRPGSNQTLCTVLYSPGLHCIPLRHHRQHWQDKGRRFVLLYQQQLVPRCGSGLQVLLIPEDQVPPFYLPREFPSVLLTAVYIPLGLQLQLCWTSSHTPSLIR
ncbi:uncharacterized protein LOC125704419 isoform X2 [Brienomyrus brachyistius]|uniref:uncharacterized protein LOC125704419 isoform X2 n=1 Tax=Brienomyrus brachyistius TaxID=42636 RepID=UPI0020B2FCF5|nr:uncharacterized protein LOC125704419 isoform X2 [Brienomyrus brachyistius]